MNEKNKLDTKIDEVEAGWSEAVVMVCTDCGGQFSTSELQNSPERIKADLKAVTKANLGKGVVRVINTTCLNICPENKIAITVAKKNSQKVFEAFAVSNDVTGEEVFNKIFKK